MAQDYIYGISMLQVYIQGISMVQAYIYIVVQGKSLCKSRGKALASQDERRWHPHHGH